MSSMKSGFRLSYISVSFWVVLYASICVLLLFEIRKNEEIKKKNQDLRAELVSINAHIRHDLEEIQSIVRINNALNFLVGARLDSSQMIRVTHGLRHLSKKFGMDPLLVLALVSVESRGNPVAKGRYRSGKLSGALGFMQIKTETARLVAKSEGLPFQGKKDLLNPGRNIVFGTIYLMSLIEHYESLKLGIMAYNIGPGGVNLALKGKMPFPRRYYNRVLTNYFGLIKRFGSV